MIKKISIIGTESSGKTGLAAKLAEHYKTIYVPDYSRTYIQMLERKYNHSDVLKIAEGIIEQEDKMAHLAHRILITDNDLVNIKIWLRYYKWPVPDWLEKDIITRLPDLYLLCEPDIPWVGDEQRQNAHDRMELFHQFREELAAINANFKSITGFGVERLEMAVSTVDELLMY
ncbi:MAG: ATP-binding protein [Bacteroidetes bacterium]|nr:ATP-binding protein [Bacteroidota bacterium]